MKNIICISFVLLLHALSNCNAQVRDSVCIHNFTKDNWQSIRHIDSAGYSGYLSNSENFRKIFYKDSLRIQLRDNSCLPETIFIGEYTTRDSIHFIDFIKIVRPHIRICLEGICNKLISRNQLPQLHKMTLCTNVNSIELVSYDLYIQHDSGVSVFKIIGPGLPAEAQNSIMRLKENKFISVENVKVMGSDGKRTIDGTTYQVKN